MTARVTLYCDGRIGPAQYECRQALPVGAVPNGSAARQASARDGWSAQVSSGVVHDLCPACTRRKTTEQPGRPLRVLSTEQVDGGVHVTVDLADASPAEQRAVMDGVLRGVSIDWSSVPVPTTVRGGIHYPQRGGRS